MNLEGIFPPITTPFRDDRLDEPRLKANVRRWLDTGLHGIVVLGSSGEAVLLEDDECDRAIAAARTMVPRDRVLIAGTGRESTEATIAATKRAAAAGADVAIVRTPSFFKNQMTGDVFVRHYRAVADRSPIPILLYNVTVFTAVNMLPPAVAELAVHPNIVGIKESGGDVEQIAELVSSTPDDFVVLAGGANTFYAALCAGAKGGILALACVVPELTLRLYELARAKHHDEARDLQQQLVPLSRLITSTYGISGLKAAVDLVGYPSGPPRWPLPPATPAVIDHLKLTLDALAQVTV